MAIRRNSPRARHSRRGPVTEINVAPFVDVMLVLVIIFMVAAPLLKVGVPVDLPKARMSALNDQRDPLVVSIDSAGKIYLQEAEVPEDVLVPRLLAVTEANRDLRIFVRGDRAISYGRVMEVMGMVSQAGFSKVALVAEVPEARGAGK